MNNVKLNVLVVDDERLVREYFSRYFKNKNVELDFAESGDKAVELACSKKYDLIFMDVVLPEIHGVKAYEKIVESGQNIPTVLMTAYAVPGLLDRGKLYGVKRILLKPFSVREIDDIWEEIIKEKNQPIP